MRNKKIYATILTLFSILALTNCGGGSGGEAGKDNYIKPKITIADNSGKTCPTSNPECKASYTLTFTVDECTADAATDPFCGTKGGSIGQLVTQDFSGATEATTIGTMTLPFSGRVKVWVNGFVTLKNGTLATINTFTQIKIATVETGLLADAPKPSLGKVNIGTNDIATMFSVQGSSGNILPNCVTEIQNSEREVCVPATYTSVETPGCWFNFFGRNCYFTCHVAGICFTQVPATYSCEIVIDQVPVEVCY